MFHPSLSASPPPRRKGTIQDIHNCCELGMHQELSDLLVYGTYDLNEVDSNGNTALHLATFFNHKKVVSILLQYDANVSAVDVQGKTPLYIATQQGYRGSLKILTFHTNETTINLADNNGLTPMMVACSKGYLACLKLLWKGSDNIGILSTIDSNGATALHYAGYFGKRDCVDFLINCGASLHLTDRNGSTPLHYAVLNGQKEVALLLDKLVTASNIKQANSPTDNNGDVLEKNSEKSLVRARLLASEFGSSFDLSQPRKSEIKRRHSGFYGKGPTSPQQVPQSRFHLAPKRKRDDTESSKITLDLSKEKKNIETNFNLDLDNLSEKDLQDLLIVQRTIRDWLKERDYKFNSLFKIYPTAPAVNSFIVRRQMWQSIYHQEKVYYAKLCAVERRYKIPAKNILEPSDHQLMFWKFDAILNISKSLLKKFDKFSIWPHCNYIGKKLVDVIVRNISTFNEFATKFEDMLNLYRKLKQNNKNFSSLESNEIYGEDYLQIASYFLLPPQQLSNYITYINMLISTTLRGHVDYEYLQKAYNSIDAVVYENLLNSFKSSVASDSKKNRRSLALHVEPMIEREEDTNDKSKYHLRLIVVGGSAFACRPEHSSKEGFQNPFVEFTLHGETYKTKVVKNSLNPIWNETFDVGIFDASDSIPLVCSDRDGRKSKFSGKLEIYLNNFTKQGLHEVSYPLQRFDDNSPAATGKIHFKLQVTKVQDFSVKNHKNNSDKKKKQKKKKEVSVRKLIEFNFEATKINLQGKKLSKFPFELFQMKSLQFLNIHINSIAYLPPQIGDFKYLTSLNLFGNRLTELPPTIGNLKKLAVLNVGGNKLSTLPKEIEQLINLKEIMLRWNQFVNIPVALATLPKLELLDLSVNLLTIIPVEFTNSTKLKNINLSHNKFSSLDKVLTHMPSLTHLNLIGNNISVLSDCVRYMKALIKLELQCNPLEDLPPEISNLTSLQVLNLGKCLLERLPDEISNLENLRDLDISNNPLVMMRDSVTPLPKLKNLYLFNCSLARITPQIGSLSSLTQLYLSNNIISTLPHQIGKLCSLKKLHLENNKIEAIPMQIKKLKSLNELVVTGNLLSELPDEICECTGLILINLHDNRISSLPKDFGNMKILSTLILSYNSFLEFPNSLTDCTSLRELIFSGNGLSEIPKEISKLVNLRKFWLGYNEIEHLPTEINNLFELRDFFLSGNKFLEIPEGLLQLSNLKELSLCNMKIEKIPDRIIELKQLEVFHMSNGVLTTVPKLPSSLIELNLSSHLLNFDAENNPFLNLHNLVDIDLSNNHLEKLPISLYALHELIKLKVSGNSFINQYVIESNSNLWISSDQSVSMATEGLKNSPVVERTRRNSVSGQKSHTTSLLRCKAGWSERKGRRPDQQDTLTITFAKTNSFKNGHFLALFDGHSGSDCSQYCASHLSKKFTQNLVNFSVVDSLQLSLQQIQTEITEKKFKDGTTAVITYISDTSIFFANVGDSRAVLYYSGKQLYSTRDHKPDDASECQRIKEIGGFVSENGRVNGELATSHALGDCNLQPYVTYLGDIEEYVMDPDLNKEKLVLIMACDGLWDVCTNEKAYQLIEAIPEPFTASVRLRDYAYESGSLDNISVIVTYFGIL